MAGLMEEVLVLGRAEAGKLEFKPTPLDLAVLSRRIVDEVTSASGRRCDIRVPLGSPLPEARIDDGLVGHILSILLTNAVKYSPAGATGELQIRQADQLAVFTVRDHGIGIPEADTRRMFEAFHRGGNEGETPGSGLGLMIVKHCVDLHQGRLSFETREGQGTTFTVALPVFEAGLAPAAGRRDLGAGVASN
jgi:signal transduction histidine kinase